MRPATILAWWFLGLLSFVGGARAQPTPPLPGFDLDLVVAGSVLAVSPLDDGGVVIGGSFESVAGVPRRHLAKIRADGSLDPDWDPSPDDVVFTISRPAGGAIFIGGMFREVGGERRTLVAKLALEGDGSPDPAWRPEVVGWFVATLALDEDRVLIGGYFDQVDRIARSHLARLHAVSGALDAAWAPQPDGPIYTLAVDAAQHVYVGGDFLAIGNVAQEQLARVSASVPVVVDAGWVPAPDGIVTEILPAPGGELYVAGYFGNIGGQPRNGLARLKPGDAQADAWNPAPDSGVTSLALDGQGGILVAGTFTHIGTADQAHVARLHTAGTGLADTDWAHRFDDPPGTVRVGSDGGAHVGGGFRTVDAVPQLAYSRIDPQGTIGRDHLVGLPGRAHAVAADSAVVYVAGHFDRAQGRSRRNVLRMREDGTVDPHWRADTDATVLALAVQNQHLYLGGHFGTVAGTPRLHLARVDAAGDGALDEHWNPAPNAAVATLFAHEDRLYVGGQFNMIGQTARGYIARFGADGVLDAQWNPAANSQVTSIVAGDSGVYAAGNFTSIGLQPFRKLARLAAAGTGVADAQWNASATSTVHALALDEADGHLFAGGDFFSLGGKIRIRLAKIPLAGSGAPADDWSPAANASVRALALDGRGSLYVGGHFDVLAGEPQARLARLSSEHATVDPAWNPLAGRDAVDALMVRPHPGDLLAAGSFATMSGERRAAVAALPLRATHRLTSEAIGEGSVSPSSRWVADGTPASIRSAPASGYRVESVTAAGCDISHAGDDVWKTDDLRADCHVVARFGAATHRVLVDADAGGEWRLAPGQDFPLDAVPHGTAVSLQIERAPEAHAVRVAGCGGEWAGDLYRTAPIVADCSVRIDFDLRPVLQGEHYTLLEDEWLQDVVSAEDDGDALRYSVRHAPDQGFVSLDTGLGVFEYWPHADYNGEDGFAIAASDGSGYSSPAWFTIDVLPVNDAPLLTLDEPVIEPQAQAGPRTRPRFATFVAGPEEEPGAQAVHGFLIEAIDDPADIVVDASIAIDAAGTLLYTLTGHTGTANIVARVRDTGGVENGGVDVSLPEAFRIVVQPGPDLAVELRVAGDAPTAGEPFQVIVDASNLDAAQGTAARLDVTMPDALASAAWACVPEASTTPCPAPPHDTGVGDIEVDLTLPASTHLRFLVDAVVPPETGVLRFEGAIAGAQDDDPDSANNAAQLEVVPQPTILFADGFEAVEP